MSRNTYTDLNLPHLHLDYFSSINVNSKAQQFNKNGFVLEAYLLSSIT